ncbi:hypothetical protein BK667_00690 [Pseudomonas frederiksbergensis]|nr:hypothetical protein BK667_00690 [Pseudomonas frederiksbergensis]
MILILKIKVKRSQPSAAPTESWCIQERLVGCRTLFASRLAPTILIECIREGLVGCQAAFAGKPRSYSLIEYIWQGLVGWQDAFASRLAPTV